MLDTNCMVAALSRVHRHHSVAAAECNLRIDRGDELRLAAHSLAETYSVLTRSPAPLGLQPQEASSVLFESFVNRGEVVALDPAEYESLLQGLPARGIAGGLVYDAIIAECARKGPVDEFLTFNPRHMLRVVDPAIRVIVPAEH